MGRGRLDRAEDGEVEAERHHALEFLARVTRRGGKTAFRPFLELH